MTKKYQVFISSTYEDLKAERLAVSNTVLEMDCIPAGKTNRRSILWSRMEI